MDSLNNNSIKLGYNFLIDNNLQTEVEELLIQSGVFYFLNRVEYSLKKQDNKIKIIDIEDGFVKFEYKGLVNKTKKIPLSDVVKIFQVKDCLSLFVLTEYLSDEYYFELMQKYHIMRDISNKIQ